MLHGGAPAQGFDELFKRVFWKSEFLAAQAKAFWKHCKWAQSNGGLGVSVSEWREWTEKRGMSVGQFYNMIHGLVGAGMLEKREERWYVSVRFLVELNRFILTYSAETGGTK